MAAGFFLLILALGALTVGIRQAQLGRRMRGFATTTGRVVERELVGTGFGNREGRWGSGGGYAPNVHFTYVVGGREYRRDRSSFVRRGLRRELAQRALDAIPDEVEVHYNPANPDEAFLSREDPRLGYAFVAGGLLGLLVALALLAA